MATPDFFDETRQLASDGDGTSPLRAVLRWLAVVAPFAALAWIDPREAARRGAEGLTAAAVYGALAQVLPADALAWTAAALGIGLVIAQPHRIVAQAVLATIVVLWALPPLGVWLEAGIASLGTDPVFVIDLPSVRDMALHLLPTVPLLGLLYGRVEERQLRFGSAIIATGLGLVAAHILFKQVLGIETLTRFVEVGFLERTLWQALLLGASWLAANGLVRVGPRKPLAIGLAALSLAHFLLYSWLIHNPLWDRQALGPLPIANLALAAYAVAIGAVLSLRLWLEGRYRPWLDGLVVALAAFGALTLVRQAFGGSIPYDVPIGATEDLVRSLAGILLAFGFLFVGARRQERSWRVGSLVLMLVAVGKVFGYDAAGLDGLMRIASFVALGLALIFIGWFYARLLGKPAAAHPSAPEETT